MTIRNDLRNVAIIAHVDHGKTTLVDALLRQTGASALKADVGQDCMMDSNPQERERGITILAKCTSVPYKDTRINIVDTPGHADFSGEVERILSLVEGVLLLVDASEGPMPQTRFVLRKALARGLHPIVVINKMDRPHADPASALEDVQHLFIDLDATDAQLDFPLVYAAGRDGWASLSHAQKGTDMTPLFDLILDRVSPPDVDDEKPFQMLSVMVDDNSYVGRMAIGRVGRGSVGKGQPVSLIKKDASIIQSRVTKVFGFFGLQRLEIERARAGDIVAVAGVEGAEVGDTVTSPDAPEALPRLVVDEPTLSMEFRVNDSPFAGRDGKFLTSRHLRERLLQEAKTNVGLRIEETDEQNVFKISGRGELHLSVLIETMRREGFELAVSRPEVIYKTVDGKVMEPAELLVVCVAREFQGALMECLGRRGGEIRNIEMEGSDTVRLESVVPARGMIGFKSELLTQTRGTGIMHHSFFDYVPKSGDTSHRAVGVLVAMEPGVSTTYALDSLQERSQLFVGPALDIYQGMIVGANARENDMIVNPCKRKALTNMRAAGSDDTVQLTPPREFTLEQALEFIEEDELVEVTPKNIRMRKKQLNYSVKKRWD